MSATVTRTPTPTPTPQPAPPTPAPNAPVRTRKRPAIIGLGAALIAVCGLGGAWIASQGGESRSVMVAAAPIQAGHTITASDVRPTHIDGAADIASASDATALVGKVAGSNIPAGAVIAPDMLGPVLAGSKNSVFGVAVKPGSIPTTGLQAGDKIRLVLAPSAAGGQAGAAPAAKVTSWPATIIAVGSPREDGTRSIDVTMSTASSVIPASYAASGQLVVTLERRGGQ